LKLVAIAIFAVAVALPGQAPAAFFDEETFRDPVDGRFDTSRWLLDHKGFLPIPILITEPAVGYGGGVRLLFFHRNPETSPRGQERDGTRRFEPPDITGGAAFGTENGSKGGGIGHLGFGEGRRWRYAAAAASGSFNLAWYGLPGAGEGQRAAGLDFNIDGKVTLADVRRRFGDTEWWAGLRYVGAKTRVQFALRAPTDIPARQFDTVTSGLGVVVEYDGRDNIFTPSGGVRAYFEALKYAEAQSVDGDVPFYAVPYIQLRGIPAMRYQGERTVVAEIEARWNLDGRWSLVGFAGAGRRKTRSTSPWEAPGASSPVRRPTHFVIPAKAGIQPETLRD
jgi:hypothetical protein